MNQKNTLADVVSLFEKRLVASPQLRIKKFVDHVCKDLCEPDQGPVADLLIPVEIAHRVRHGLQVQLSDYESLSPNAASIADFSLKKNLGIIVRNYETRWKEYLESESDSRPKTLSIKSVLSNVDKKYQGKLFRRLLEIEIANRKANGETVAKTDFEEFGNSAVEFADELIKQQQPATNAEKVGLSTFAEPEAKFYSAQEFRPGEIIERYKLVEPIGKGGMGQVWLAEQLHPVRRPVALKLMQSDAISAQLIARFESERQALAIMDHPNILKVIGGGETKNNLPYYTMELVKGLPITQFCDQNKLTIEQRLELFTKVCKAINHAHSKGIIHRDLKPDNILVTTYDDHPEPKILDFGLAKATTSEKLSDKKVETVLGQILGTPSYMSPEQADLGSTEIDEKTDIYALGIILFELVVGSTPISQKDLGQLSLVEVLSRIRKTPPPSLAQRLSDSQAEVDSIVENRATDVAKLQTIVGDRLNSVVQKACSIDPCDRYQSGREMAKEVSTLKLDDLNPYGTLFRTDGSSDSKLSDPKVEIVPPRKRRRKLVAGLIIGSVLVMLIAAGEYIRRTDSLFFTGLGRTPETIPEGLDSKETRPQRDIDEKPAEPAVLPLTLTNSLGIEFRLIPAGEFLMGSPEHEADHRRDETQHKVEISRAYYIGLKEVSQAQWFSVMETKPWHGKTGVGSVIDDDSNFPATYVSWHDAVEFCNRLEEKTTDVHRLPTEAEWEFACRSEKDTAYCFGDSADELGGFAWFEDNIESDSPQLVGQKQPNAFGLFDMHGNVWEWCADHYDKDYYPNSPRLDPRGGVGPENVIRGGSWFYEPSACRSANRMGMKPGTSNFEIGFRVVQVH